MAVGLRTGDVLELHVGLRSLNVSVACQCCALLSHILTLCHLVPVVDSCCITRSRVFSSLLKKIFFSFHFSDHVQVLWLTHNTAFRKRLSNTPRRQCPGGCVGYLRHQLRHSSMDPR